VRRGDSKKRKKYHYASEPKAKSGCSAELRPPRTDPTNFGFYEKLTSVTVLRQRAYPREDTRWVSTVGDNRHLKGITNEIKAIAAGAVSQSLNERVGISQSSVQILEEPNGTTCNVVDLNSTGSGPGVDQGGQENDSNCKRAVEVHCVEG
jgi:hypothetical protein